jgi:hypothetical protein
LTTAGGEAAAGDAAAAAAADVAVDGRLFRGSASCTVLCVSCTGGGVGRVNVEAVASICAIASKRGGRERREGEGWGGGGEGKEGEKSGAPVTACSMVYVRPAFDQ